MKKLVINCLVAGFWMLPISGAASANATAAFEIQIGSVFDVGLGDTVELPINYISGSETFAAFNLLISFDAYDLTFIKILKGELLTNCNWDDFSFAPVACPDPDRQLYLITATANSKDDPLPGCPSSPGELARLRLKLPVNVSFAGSLFTIDFYWVDCASNILTSMDEDTTWYAKFVYDYQGADLTGTHPNMGGTLPGCVFADPSVPIRGINYQNGAVSITDQLGLFGDINGDGVLNITDATYLVRFIFYAGPPPQDYLNGDVNMDGNTDIADIVYLIEYLFGGP
ncbi:MAG: hypothetical protein KAT58_05535 [candidate division Zixibacteria bacterium]|nr:hypothetical protein [candidate division Zixibacteria bacterium]